VSNQLPIQISSEEWEAVRLAWNSGDPIPEHEAVRLLVEIRSRKADIEARAASLAVCGISEGRRVPRRHQLFAFAVLAVSLAILTAVLAMIFR
jgi:hypothetical protein